MILRIDHVGLVTHGAAGVAALLAALGLERTDLGRAPDFGVACEFWGVAGATGGPTVEVVSPLGDDSAVAGRLARAGPGLYHVAFEVDDVERELTRLSGNGIAPVDGLPRSGARPGMRVAFVYLPKPASVLVELVEYTAGAAVTPAPAAGGRR